MAPAPVLGSGAGEGVVGGDRDRAGVGPGARQVVGGEAAGVEQDLLGGVRGERLQRPGEQQDRGDQRLGVGAVELAALLQLLLELLDPLEEAGQVADRLVHLQLGGVVGDPREAVLAPAAQLLPLCLGLRRLLGIVLGALELDEAVVGVGPEAAQELVGEADRGVGPVQRLRRPRRPEDRDAHRVGAELRRPARRGRRRCRGASTSCARRRSPSRGRGSPRTARRRSCSRTRRGRGAPW